MKKSEEKEILEALESGEIELERPSKALLTDLAKAGENTFKKDKRINIRLSSHDLLGIQRKAVQKGIPYQGANFRTDTPIRRRRSSRKTNTENQSCEVIRYSRSAASSLTSTRTFATKAMIDSSNTPRATAANTPS